MQDFPRAMAIGQLTAIIGLRIIDLRIIGSGAGPAAG
jgi:hypothetical protein